MVVVSILLLLSNLFATANPNDGPDGTYSCSKLTEEEACKATGWCVWQTIGSQCVYDKCLKWVADDDTAPCAATGYGADFTDYASWVCTLYYLTDAHNCTDGSEIQTDRYCRSNVVSNRRNPMEECFYNDLKARAKNPPENYCPNPLCTQTSNSDGKYCAPTGNPACDTFYQEGSYDQFCNCLSLGEKSYCDLFPGCQNTSAGCIVDPCYRYTGQNYGGCVGLPSTQIANCANQTVNKPNADFTDAVPGAICVTTGRSYSTINSCFYLQQTSVTAQTFPECLELVENEAVCIAGPVLTSSGTPDGDKMCAFAEIAGHYFEAVDGHYCNDGARKNGVPSPSAASSTRVPLLVALTLAGLALLA